MRTNVQGKAFSAFDRVNDEKESKRKRLFCIVRNVIKGLLIGALGFQYHRINPFLTPLPPTLQTLFDHNQYQYHPPEPRNPASFANTSTDQCGEGPSYERYFHNLANPLHRSVNNEDKTLYETLFQHDIAQYPQKRRTYIELGAFDGLQESNTRFMDECLGWDGILIEGNPKKYPLLLNNRPYAHRLNFAPSCSVNSVNETIPFHSVAFTNGGLAGYANAYQEGHMIVQVPCGSLTPVLQELAPQGIDFFSLDVEGSEPLIVKNIDFETVRIDILMVESWNQLCPQEPLECETRTQTRDILQNAGYHRYSKIIKKSDLYIHPQSPYLAQLPADQYPRDG